MVILKDKKHKTLWEHVLNNLEKPIPEIVVTELNSCKEAYATILFFDDTSVTKKASSDYAMPLENFESWSLQTNAMVQYAIWAGVSYAGYGANIQHYNSLVKEAIKKFNIPKNWKLIAQMSIGVPKNTPDEHSHLNFDEVIKLVE
jgi:predicted oxidoreductase (fatty acid repression mutant protein)